MGRRPGRPRRSAIVWRFVLLPVAVAMWGCAMLPTSQRPASARRSAKPSPTTTRWRASLTASTAAGDRGSGLRLLPDGGQALEARIALAPPRERTIDVQYYQIANDPPVASSCTRWAAPLIAACACGCWSTTCMRRGEDQLLAGLAAGPERRGAHVQPAAVRGGAVGRCACCARCTSSRAQPAHAQQALHRRQRFAIGGGRNIADEYFGRSQPPTSSTWTCSSPGRWCASCRRCSTPTGTASMPIRSRAWWRRAHRRSPARSSTRGRTAAGAGAADRERDPLGQGPVGAQLASGRVELRPASVRVMADAPVKATPTSRPWPTASS